MCFTVNCVPNIHRKINFGGEMFCCNKKKGLSMMKVVDPHMCFFCDVNSDVSGGTTIISCNSGRCYWWTCHTFLKHCAGRYILRGLLYKIHRSLCFMFSFCSALWWVDDVLLIYLNQIHNL